MHQAKLVSIGTAVPPHRIAQDDAAATAHKGFAGRFPDFDRLVAVFRTSGIKTRYAARPLDWYLQPLGWPERNAAYIETASALFVEAATQALQRAGMTADEIDTIVTVSSTGIATPTLEVRVAEQMGFRADVERVPVFGLGCAGGVTGLSIGARLAAGGGRDRTVLVVAVEICTLSFRLDQLSKANIVATALFGDGAAACILRPGEGGLAAVELSGEHTWPQTLDIMGWTVDPVGLGVVFDRSIPPFAEENLKAAVTSILAAGDLTVGDIDRFCCHPGGAKVVEALETCLSLPQGSLTHERDILAEYGNMSAPTVLFVLDRLVREGLPGRTLLTALGPGFTASCVSLKTVA